MYPVLEMRESSHFRTAMSRYQQTCPRQKAQEQLSACAQSCSKVLYSASLSGAGMQRAEPSEWLMLGRNALDCGTEEGSDEILDFTDGANSGSMIVKNSTV